jgi:N-acetylneuraminate synthase/N,N'-diacetyllegionaminate synthase
MKRDRVLIIAEAGVNHNGDMNQAKKLIDAAFDAGVDMVKFQTFKADDLVSKSAKKAEYQQKNIGGDDDSQYSMLKNLELSNEQHQELIEYCDAKGIHFFSTAFDVKGLDYLFGLGFEMFKVPSGEITNYPYLKKLAEFGKPVILSTGMASIVEVQDALKVLTRGIDKSLITVLHCNTEYPTPMEDVNLLAMQTIASKCGVDVGYSDHTLGVEVPISAVALGAKVIEKHFTLNRNLPGPDHRASLEPDELKLMVKSIRNIEKAIFGSGQKEPSNSESRNKDVARKSIHLSCDLKEGDTIDETNIIPLRPGDGISPMDWTKIIGKKVNKNLKAFAKLSYSDLA